MAANIHTEKIGTSSCVSVESVTNFPVDVVALRLEIENQSKIPEGLSFNWSMATNPEGGNNVML